MFFKESYHLNCSTRDFSYLISREKDFGREDFIEKSGQNEMIIEVFL